MKKENHTYINKNIKMLESSLYDLCTDFILFLDQLLNLDVITNKEYEELSKEKRSFTNSKGKPL